MTVCHECEESHRDHVVKIITIRSKTALIDTQSLKNKILDLAIRGKLTRQLPDDGTAEELYEKIQEEKQALVEAGKIKKEKPLKEIEKDEVPFEIPENWKWVHWGNLAESIQYGYNAPAKESGRIKMVRISDIQDNEVMWDYVPFCDISEDEIKGYLLHENDILFARTGHTVGKSYIVRMASPNTNPCISSFSFAMSMTCTSSFLICFKASPIRTSSPLSLTESKISFL